MLDNMLYSLLMFGLSAYIFYLWVCDVRAVQKPKNALAGSEFAPKRLLILGSIGALVLVFLYTICEEALGISAEQSTVKVWAIFSWIGAAFMEELIFRGYLNVQNRGRAVLIFSCLGFSILFALAHPFLWDYSAEGGLVFNIGLAGFFSTICIFINSVFFYALRFTPHNVKRSLLPCIVAHFSYNLGVFFVKAAQGFVQW